MICAAGEVGLRELQPAVDVLQSLAIRAPGQAREREILRVAASVEGRDRLLTASKAKREILQWTARRAGGRLPKRAWQYEEFEYLVGGRNCQAVRIGDDARETWAIRSDDPDKEVPRRVWTTECFVACGPGYLPLFGLRLLVTTPEPELFIEPAVPGVVRQLASTCGLVVGHGRLDPQPAVVRADGDAARLIEFLLDPSRRVPVFVASVSEQSEPFSPLIDVEHIAAKCLGLAVTVVVPARFTWMLTERFGKQLSVYNGAVRVYLPGSVEDANPYEHELILAERILRSGDGAGRVLNRLQHIAAKESRRRCRLGHDVLSFADVRERSDDHRLQQLRDESASESVQLVTAQRQIETLKVDLRKAEESAQFFLDEYDAVESRAKKAEGTVQWMSFRVDQLKRQLEAQNESPDSNIPLPVEWRDFADWCHENFAPRVVLSSRARREIKDAKFDGVEVAARCVRWLANEYYDKRKVGGEGDVRGVVEPGIQNDRCGADSFEVLWQERKAQVEWHIKNGGNTRDPRRCLRIYDFWDEKGEQAVIVSMPAHVRSGAT